MKIVKAKTPLADQQKSQSLSWRSQNSFIRTSTASSNPKSSNAIRNTNRDDVSRKFTSSSGNDIIPSYPPMPVHPNLKTLAMSWNIPEKILAQAVNKLLVAPTSIEKRTIEAESIKIGTKRKTPIEIKVVIQLEDSDQGISQAELQPLPKKKKRDRVSSSSTSTAHTEMSPPRPKEMDGKGKGKETAKNTTTNATGTASTRPPICIKSKLTAFTDTLPAGM